ncbi:MAG: biotin--[acetyl-CoA-carboxylase] ligase [Mariprofundaceae bacterium]
MKQADASCPEWKEDELPLNPSLIKARLKTMLLGQECLMPDEVDSTNLEIMRLARQGAEEGLVIIAKRQRHGRGRMGRHWHAFGEESLAMSVLLRPNVSPDQASRLSLVAAVGVHDALSAFAPKVRIKWPNDILFGGKKLAGILTEMQSEAGKVQAIAVGIGINLAPPLSGWPEEIKHQATDLGSASGLRASRLEVALQAISCLENVYMTYLQQGFVSIRERWWQAHAASGKPVHVHDGTTYIRGIARKLDDNGMLIIETETGLQRIVAGDLEIV